MSTSSERPGERRLIDSALEQVRALRERVEPARAPELPGYRLLAEIHRGGQGVVYHALQATTGQEVAIKFLRDAELSASARARFEREVAVLARLKHRNLVAIHDCGVHDGRFFCVMDFVPGRDLSDELAAGGRSLRETVELFARIAEAVGAAHLRGVLHRDLKPSNIRVDPEGEPRLLDFGLAKWMHEEEGGGATTSGGFVGSAPWASPEQVAGKPLDVRSDVYSLGVVFHQGLTGAFPYDVSGPLARVFDSILTSAPLRASRARPEIDADLDTILLKALSKEPERRYQSALELARDLRHWLSGEPLDARRESALYVLRKTLRRHWAATATAAAVFLLVLFAAVAIGISRARWRSTAGRLEALLHAQEMRRIAEAFQTGDETLIRQSLEGVPAERRDWLHAHFRGRLERRRWRFDAPGERLLGAALSPDGERVAVGSWEGDLRLLDASTGGLLWQGSEPLADIRAIAFHPSSGELVTVGSQGLSVFDGRDGRLRRAVETPSGLEVVSVSEHRILAASAAGVALLFDFQTGELLRELRCRHPALAGSNAPSSFSGIAGTAVCASRERVATMGRDLVRVWDMAPVSAESTGEPVLSVPVRAPRDQAFAAIALSADGARVAVATIESAEVPGVLLVLDVDSGRHLLALENLAISPTVLALQEEACLVGSRSGLVRALDLAGGRELERLPGRDERIVALALGPGDELAVLDGGLALWQLDEEPAVELPAGGAQDRGLRVEDEDETWTADEEGTLARHAPGAGALVVARGPARPSALALDDSRVAVAAREGLVLFERRTGERLAELASPGREELTALAFLGGEGLLAAGASDGRVWILDLAHGDPLCALGGPGGAVRELRFDRERGELVALDGEGRVRVYRGAPPERQNSTQ